MHLLSQLEQQLHRLDEQKLLRRRRVADTPCAPHVTVDGRPMLAFCSNDYLGLAAHPRLVEALQEGAAKYGAGSGASHLISGHSRAHDLLEERFAELMSPYIEQARALTFCTGYMANLAVLTALAAASAASGRDTDLFSESLNHASLIDGARLSRANVKVYAHGDIEALEGLLKASTSKTKIVATDSVFSMDGDLAPLPALLALCERHDAWLVVDDAHGFGVLGEHGHGALEHFGLRSPNLVYMGTLGKAAGVGGAFVAAHATVIEWLVQRARPYIYTTAAPPALSHALLASLDLITGEEGMQRRAHLRQLVAQLQDGLRLKHWQLLPSRTAIQPVIIGSNEPALRAAALLHEQGLWVPAIRPPTVPAGTARLRITLSAAHVSADVARLAQAFNAAEREIGEMP
ncbi:8-amino-7-oxononanoate synthase [Noviherbaspirillum sp. CPCC 100848]|uniref:8-amino-7-oxononanoate synthase n=1 Tax=Noviherbaspirillum album TaxID=3080276 RepID=A0ABU6J5Q4_9BURK|nr:8-amino-7-oxononanoate synthase [Noviherbaspirillum sp. CPCC 100848]MEC4718985.1 8-amino-7-oxononanoate synthase [Noviherbaspirillum sp. CPCC 100848]